MTERNSFSRLAIGKIVKGHGLKGYLRVISYSGDSEHLLKLKEVYLLINQEFKKYRLEDIRRDKKNILVKLEGVDKLEEALKFILLELWVDREQAAPLKEGEFYEADIHACAVYQKDIYLGQVKAILTGGHNDLLEVITPGNRSLIIPLEAHFIKSININEKRIQIEEDFEFD